MTVNYRYPFNQNSFKETVKFSKEIISICKDNNIDLIIYGSYCVFYHTGSKEMPVNDVDFLLRRNDVDKLIKIIERQNIDYNYDKKWLVLQLFKGDIKIEFDVLEFWQKELKESDLINIDFYGNQVKTLTYKAIKQVYLKALKNTDDNTENIKDKLRILESF